MPLPNFLQRLRPFNKDPPPASEEPTRRPASTVTIGQQQLLAGYNSSASRPLSLHNAVYSFTRRIPRITRKSNYCADALSPESQGGITDLDDIENGRSHVGSLPPMRDPPLVADYHRSDEREGGQSGGRVSQWAPRQSKTTDGPPILAPNDPQPFDCSNPQEGQTRNQVYDHAGGAGRSRTESTKDFRADFDHDMDDNDEGDDWPGVPRNDRGASGVVLVPALPYPAPGRGGGLVLYVGKGPYQGTQLSNNPLWDHLVQHNRSKTPDPRTSYDTTYWQELFPSPGAPLLRLAEIDAECQRQPSQELIDKLDMTLDHMTCDEDRRELLNILCKMCSRQRMMPKSMHVDEPLSEELIEEYHGGHATIFRGIHKGRPVAVKTVTIYLTSDFGECLSKFCREAVAWRHLRHPGILPLLGVDLEPQRLAMVSEWMNHGNINEFVKRHGRVNRVQLLADVANGLEYMHSSDMVHGDLKGANILINQSYRACLADFGLSTIVSKEHHTVVNPSLISVASVSSLMSFTAGGTTRWMSPELLDPERFGTGDGRPTKQSDSYALGMVVYEVLCGNPPYWDIANKGAVIHAITEGVRPEKPEEAEGLGFTEGLWGVVQRCWLVDPSARPDVRKILSHLNHATWSWERRRVV